MSKIMHDYCLSVQTFGYPMNSDCYFNATMRHVLTGEKITKRFSDWRSIFVWAKTF